jgi:hypothetical protein
MSLCVLFWFVDGEMGDDDKESNRGFGRKERKRKNERIDVCVCVCVSVCVVIFAKRFFAGGFVLACTRARVLDSFSFRHHACRCHCFIIVCSFYLLFATFGFAALSGVGE